MGVPNWENRTLFHRDNLDFVRAMNSEMVFTTICQQVEFRSSMVSGVGFPNFILRK